MAEIIVGFVTTVCFLLPLGILYFMDLGRVACALVVFIFSLIFCVVILFLSDSGHKFLVIITYGSYLATIFGGIGGVWLASGYNQLESPRP
jgi:hypothetical protein